MQKQGRGDLGRITKRKKAKDTKGGKRTQCDLGCHMHMQPKERTKMQRAIKSEEIREGSNGDLVNDQSAPGPNDAQEKHAEARTWRPWSNYEEEKGKRYKRRKTTTVWPGLPQAHATKRKNKKATRDQERRNTRKKQWGPGQ